VIILATPINPKSIGVPLFTLRFSTSTSSHLITYRGHPQCSSPFFGLFSHFPGFNGGAVLALTGVANAVTMSLAVVNTVLAASGGGMAALLMHLQVPALESHTGRKHWSMMQVCNGMIAGMVSICAGANTVYPWAAFFIGFIGGLVYKAWSIAVRKAGVDDPLDAGAVHLGAGAWGLVAVTLFAVPKESPLSSFGTPGGLAIGGIFYDAQERYSAHLHTVCVCNALSTLRPLWHAIAAAAPRGCPSPPPPPPTHTHSPLHSTSLTSATFFAFVVTLH
jgi:hypothetical protein